MMTNSRIGAVFISLSEAESGMKSIETENASSNNGTLQANEVFLSLDQMPRPTFAELGNTIDTSCEDTQSSKNESINKALECKAVTQSLVFGIERVVHTQNTDPLDSLVSKIKRQSHEDEERKDLNDQARQHNMIARLRILSSMCSTRSHTTAGSLKHQREEIAGYENFRIEIWSEAAVFGTKSHDDSSKTEVKTGGIESWSYSQTDYLNKKGILVEGGTMSPNSTSITKNFEETAGEHRYREPNPFLGQKCLDHKGDERYAE